LEDCISIEHLGQFLAMISLYHADKAMSPKRDCPEGFNVGKPNLIVCPEVDIWRAILSVYMHSSDQGLPTAAEVLVCSQFTTTEEVELLLRRALQSPTDDSKFDYLSTVLHSIIRNKLGGFCSYIMHVY